jgi:hypothetical protein
LSNVRSKFGTDLVDVPKDPHYFGFNSVGKFFALVFLTYLELRDLKKGNVKEQGKVGKKGIKRLKMRGGGTA